MNISKLLVIGVIFGFIFSGCSRKNMYVMETEIGNIEFKVYPDKASITVNNFVRYVENNDFEGATFYRVVRMDNQPNDKVRIEVIQGNFIANEKSFETIKQETTAQTGVLHRNGTISMARGEPDSAAAAFFICINDQPELDFGGKRNPDGQGFAAFGDVVEGMDIVKIIQSGDTDKQTLKKPIIIKSIKKL